MTRNDTQFKLRFPQEVKEWLEKEAARNLRSLNAEVNVAIRDKMERGAAHAATNEKTGQ